MRWRCWPPARSGAAIVAPLRGGRRLRALEHDTDGAGAAVLAALANWRRGRRRLVAGRMTIVGITGSVGQDVDQDLIAAVLRAAGRVVAPPARSTTKLGHPLDRAARHRRHRLPGAGDVGAAPGNIAALAAIAPPSIAAVLNVGTAHLGEFGSREAIAADEIGTGASGSGLRGGGAQRRRPGRRRDGRKTAARVVRVAADPRAADVRAGTSPSTNWPGRASPCEPPAGAVPVQLAVHGEHQVSNALQRGGGRLECGATLEQVAAALAGAGPGLAAPDGGAHPRRRRHRHQRRLQRQPDSMRAGLKALAGWRRTRADRRRGPQLGGAREMGNWATTSITEHDRIGRLAVRLDISRLVVVGTGRPDGRHAPRGGHGGFLGFRRPPGPRRRRRPGAAARRTAPGDVVLVRHQRGQSGAPGPRRWPARTPDETDPHRRRPVAGGLDPADAGADPAVHPAGFGHRRSARTARPATRPSAAPVDGRRRHHRRHLGRLSRQPTWSAGARREGPSASGSAGARRWPPRWAQSASSTTDQDPPPATWA